MSIRKYTNAECPLTRKWEPPKVSRSDNEKAILSKLPDNLCEYFASGGTVTVGNPCEITNTDPYTEGNRHQKRLRMKVKDNA